LPLSWRFFRYGFKSFFLLAFRDEIGCFRFLPVLRCLLFCFYPHQPFPPVLISFCASSFFTSWLPFLRTTEAAFTFEASLVPLFCHPQKPSPKLLLFLRLRSVAPGMVTFFLKQPTPRHVPVKFRYFSYSLPVSLLFSPPIAPPDVIYCRP